MSAVVHMRMSPAPSTILLIDLSSIAYPIWHMSQSEPNVNHASEQIVGRVRAMAQGQPHAAVCVDSGRSFRAEIDPAYKANRPERDERLHHQIKLAIDTLRGDGFPIWAAPGFEADDLISTAARVAVETTEADVVIVSGDKDLLQLVGGRVSAQSVKDGSRVNDEAVVAKFGVTPAQMRDYLTLVGDTSDNIKGVKGVGGKRAVELLAKFGTLDRLYAELHEVGGPACGLTPAITTALIEFFPRIQQTRDLITMRTDAPLDFAAVLSTREALPSTHTYATTTDYDDEAPMTETTDAPVTTVEPAATTTPDAAPVTALATRVEPLAPAPEEWERQLEPRSMKQVQSLALDMWKSGMFSAYGTPEAVLSTVLTGRELGLPAMASLRCIYNLEGKHSLSASLMVALVLKSGMAEYFEPVSFSETEATFETHRKGARNPVRLTHTFEMAQKAWPKAKADWEKAFQASGWGKNPTDMLVARATARLARMVYPDLLAGLYTPDELAEIRAEVAA